MLIEKLSIAPRQSGKTSKLRKQALALNSQFQKVIWVDFNYNTLRESRKFFKSNNTKIECFKLDILYSEPITSLILSDYEKEILPPEYKILGNNTTYIFVDEYLQMNTDQLNLFKHRLSLSKENFEIIGVAT